MALITTKHYSVAEYLELEEKAEFKSEFVDGEILALAGATANHNKISLNFCRLFPLSIGAQEYEVFMSDMRLWMSDYKRYTYPDVDEVLKLESINFEISLRDLYKRITF